MGAVNYGYGEIYIVRPSDVLSKILYNKNLKPVYGNNGSLRKVIALNEKLKPSNGNLIRPGMQLNLGIYPEPPEKSINEEPKNNSLANQALPVQEPIASQEIPRTVASQNVFSRSDLSIHGISEFLRVKGTDDSTNGSATLLSDASLGMKLAWGQNWTDKFRSFFAFQTQNVNIQDSSSSTKEITKKKQNLTSYQVGAEYKYNSRFKVNSTLAYGESLVSRSTNATTVVVEKFLAPRINAGFEYKVYEIDNLSFKALGEIGAVLPTKQDDYDSKLSLGKKIGIGVEDTIGAFKIDGQIYYQNTDLKMKGGSYDQTSLGFMVGLKKEFGTF